MVMNAPILLDEIPQILSICSHNISGTNGGCFHLPMEPRVAALAVSHTKKNWSCHMFIEIHAHISKKIPKKVHFGAIMALLKIGRWYHPPIGMQTINIVDNMYAISDHAMDVHASILDAA